MKKIMISLLMVAATLNAMAVTYSGKVKVRLTSSDSKYCEAVVATSNEFTDGLNNGYYAAFNDENKDVHLYVDYEGTRYAHFGSSATTMRNMPLVMKANSATNYTLSFSAMVGTIDIYDRKENVHIDKSQNYNFTIEAAERDANNIVANRFVINYTYVIMNGDFADPDNAWAYTSNFAHNGATASLDLDLAADTWYHFQIEENGEVGANASAFDRDNASYVVPTTGWSAQLTLYADVAGTYTFTWTYATQTLAITFPVLPPANTVTTNAYGFCSFASSEDVEFLGGLKAYKGAFNADTYELTLTEVGAIVPANTGVILWNSNQTAETFNYNTGADASGIIVSGNDFVGAVADKPVAEVSADAIYCLHGNELMKLGDGVVNIPAGKAYLPVNAAPGAPKRIVMRFNTPTAIDNVEMESIKAEKFVENGQIFIRRGNEVFNLQGQIVK